MSTGAIRAAAVVFLLGVLVVWLIRPIGSSCPDVDKLPAGSTGSSAPSFAPPLTRTCTYETPDGTQARKRYVPVVDWLLLAVIAGIAGAAVGLAGGGGGQPRAPRAERRPREQRPPRVERAPRSGPRDPEPEPERGPPPAAVAPPSEQDAAEREHARRERDSSEREQARREREAKRRR